MHRCRTRRNPKWEISTGFGIDKIAGAGIIPSLILKGWLSVKIWSLFAAALAAVNLFAATPVATSVTA